MTVPGELGEETLAWLDSHQVTRIEVDPLNYENKYRPRFVGAAGRSGCWAGRQGQPSVGSDGSCGRSHSGHEGCC